MPSSSSLAWFRKAVRQAEAARGGEVVCNGISFGEVLLRSLCEFEPSLRHTYQQHSIFLADGGIVCNAQALHGTDVNRRAIVTP